VSTGFDAGSAPDAHVEIETDVSRTSFVLFVAIVLDVTFMATIVAVSHWTGTNTSVAIDALIAINFEDVGEFSHR
jgi:hypothetical protein